MPFHRIVLEWFPDALAGELVLTHPHGKVYTRLHIPITALELPPEEAVQQYVVPAVVALFKILQAEQQP